MAMSNISTIALAVCRWEWCKETFSSQDRLVEHVLEEHVAKAVPIKRRDIPLEMHVQEGASLEDTVNTSYLLNDVFMDASADNKDNAHQSAPQVNVDPPPFQLSLPTPPREAPPGTPPRLVSKPPSPQQSRFRAIAESSSPAFTPDAGAMRKSPTTDELVAKFLSAHASPARTLSATPGRSSVSRIPQGQTPTDAGPSSAPSTQGDRSPRHQRLPFIRTGGPPPPRKHATRTSDSYIPTPLTRILNSTVTVKEEEGTHDVDLSQHSGNGHDRQARLASPLSLSQPAAQPQILSSSKTLDSSQPSQSPARSLAPPPSSALAQQARLFRTGSLCLEPSSSQADVQPMQNMPSQSQSELEVAKSLGSPAFQPPQPSANIYVSDADLYTSSLDPLIPEFSQAAGMSQSQWPLQTQAPYTVESQLDLDTQLQSQWIPRDTLNFDSSQPDLG